MDTTDATSAKQILAQFNESTKLGDVRKMAKTIKKDHELAMKLWSSRVFLPRQLAILIMDKTALSAELIDQLTKNMEIHPSHEQTQLMDWLMANQLMKSKRTIALMESWRDSALPLQRRIFWYHQGRLRWTGKTPPPNTDELVRLIEERLATEQPEVQWAMNLTAGWIGVYEKLYRSRCINIGLQTGLYKDEMVSKGCTPNYLPEFIEIERNKRSL